MNFIKSALLVTATLSVALSAQARELKLSTSAPETSLAGVRITNTAKALERLSGGTLTIKPYFSATLGDEQTAARQTVKGRIDITALSTSGMSLIAPELAIAMEPYIFEDSENTICVLNNYFNDVFAETLDKAGLVALGYINIGQSGIFSNTALNTPDDFKGIKLRTTPTPSVQNYIKSLGALDVNAGVSDMVPMLKTGAIDGADTSVIFGISLGLPKLVKNLTINGSLYFTGANVISSKTWESLSDQEKDWLVAADAESKAIYHEELIKTESALIEKAKDDATVTILTDEQRAPFKAIAEANREKAIASYGENGVEIWANLEKGIKACAAMN